ncbi:hypothetical protein B9Z19DRAFT_1066340 [Tuber borchii]|uniref:Uncharacterized protein n=1 Tax=Tuber borchii TaxID=42251 RepID=A0A2T6ZN14_TUBBO|nr:hypothetical protein B9Z19DRAFT_1066340 [Tuber borchii]
MTCLDSMGVWDAVTGKTLKPNGTDTAAKFSCIHLCPHANSFLLFNIYRASEKSSKAPITLAKVREKFNKNTPMSLHSLLMSIITLRYSNKHEIAVHIEKHDELWLPPLEQTSEATSWSRDLDSISKDTLEAALLLLVNSGVTNGAFFPTSLPNTLNNVVDNLTTKGTAIYSQVGIKLLDLYPAKQPADTNTCFVPVSSN